MGCGAFAFQQAYYFINLTDSAAVTAAVEAVQSGKTV